MWDRLAGWCVSASVRANWPDGRPASTCVKCQTTHRKGFDPEFESHMVWQGKRSGFRRPTPAEIFHRLVCEEVPSEG